MDLGLEATAELHELGPVAHELTQLPRRRWCDPGLGQPTQAQHVGQVDGVTFVVLHPSLSPVQALGVGEVHAGAVRLQEVDDPVPAVGCLDHHLGVGARSRDRGGNGERIVADALGRELVAVCIESHDHRPATMEVDTDVLSIHRGLLLFERCWCENPESPTTRSFTGSGGPAPSSHQFWRSGDRAMLVSLRSAYRSLRPQPKPRG